MSLKKTELQTAIKELFKKQQATDVAKDPEQALTDIASDLADAIYDFVTSGEVSFSSGDVVPGLGSVTGTTLVQGAPVNLLNGGASGGVIS